MTWDAAHWSLWALGVVTMLCLAMSAYLPHWQDRQPTRGEWIMAWLTGLTWPVSLVVLLIIVALRRSK